MTPDLLESAILTTVAYGDVFAFAPSPAEIHRFLIGAAASRAQVEWALSESPVLRRALGHRDGLYFLAGKDHLAPRRQRFKKHGSWLWPRARAAAQLIEKSGLAIGGLVTGSLAADNADEHADIDFLLIYPSHRTFLSFALVRVMQKTPGLGLSSLCPNYVLASDRLTIQPQNLFTAYELAKGVPVFGLEACGALARANPWVRRYLPNALPSLDAPREPKLPRPYGAWERAFALPPIAALESFERRRKFKTDQRDIGIDLEERDKKGSMDRHSPTRSFQTLSELRYRMDQLGLEHHPLYAELRSSTSMLDTEMSRWGQETIGEEAMAATGT